MNVRILGAPRSGTNYLKWLIRNNYNNVVLLNEDKNKRGAPTGATVHCLTVPDLGADTCRVITVRNPIKWLISVYSFYAARGADLPDTFSEYLRANPKVGAKFDIINYWNTSLNGWLTADETTFVVKLEDLHANSEETLTAAADHFGWTRLKGVWDDTDEVFYANSDTPIPRTKVLKSKNKISVSAEDITFLTGKFDQELLDKFGYKLEPIQPTTDIAPPAIDSELVPPKECGEGLECRTCTQTASSVTRQLLSKQLGILPEDFVCPFPELQHIYSRDLPPVKDKRMAVMRHLRFSIRPATDKLKGTRMRLAIKFDKPPGDLICLLAALNMVNELTPISFSVLGSRGTVMQDIWYTDPKVDLSITEADNDAVVIPDYGSYIAKFDELKKGHFSEALFRSIAFQLSLDIPEDFVVHSMPRLYLTKNEEDTRPHVEPYWVFMPGGKYDFTTKWWPEMYWRKLIESFSTHDALKGKAIIQLGAAGPEHYNPKFRGVINKVGQTTLREYMSYIFHAEGVVCGITSAMHIAGAFIKPCIVIAGGREGPWWEKYDGHTFIHTLGQLPCCTNPCWVSHIDEAAVKSAPSMSNSGSCRNISIMKDTANQNVEVKTPACMKVITPNIVLNAITAHYSQIAEQEDQQRRETIMNKNAIDQLGDVTILACLYGTDKEGAAVINSTTNREGTSKGSNLDPSRQLTYYELHKRCISSIANTLTEEERSNANFIIGCNEVGQNTIDYVRKTLPEAAVIIEETNINKYPLMQKMFDATMTKWGVWFDDDSYATKEGWLPRVLITCMLNKIVVAGKQYSWPLLQGQLDWIKAADWFTGTKIPKHNGNFRIPFITGGFQVLDLDELKKISWPDSRLDHNGGDVMLGVACLQQGLTTAVLGTDQAGIVISGAERRGTAQRSAGAASMHKEKQPESDFYFGPASVAKLVASAAFTELDEFSQRMHKLNGLQAKLKDPNGCKSCNRRKIIKEIDVLASTVIREVGQVFSKFTDEYKNRLLAYLRSTYNEKIDTVYYPNVGKLIGE